MTTVDIRHVTEEWSPARRQRAMDRLGQLRARSDVTRSVSHPAELAALCDPSYVMTPAVELVSKSVEQVLRGRRKNLLITAPPQEFKSYLCAVWTPLRALQLHPHWRVMLLTYADGLAEEHGSLARNMVLTYGSGVVDSFTGGVLPDQLGYGLAPEKATAGYWRITPGDGGLIAAGRDATITGRRADLLIIDDPYKGMQEADSEAIRRKVDAWYRSVARTRLAAGASTILIQTRWHPEDLAGTIIREQRELPPEQRTWRYVNIPAVSHPALSDALGREPGIPLVSSRGRTPEDWADIERTVGKRVWNALYQGSPTPPEGGLFSGSWFDDHRLDEMPDRTRLRIVAVDPAESGEGDEAGVIGAALLHPPSAEARAAYRLMAPPDAPEPIAPQIALTHDRSGQMTSDQWSAAAVQLALDTDASDIYIETYTAGKTYINVVRAHLIERAKKAAAGGDANLARRLWALTHRVHGWRGTGDSVARSGLLRQAMEVGTCVVLGHEMAEFESQARLWQTGQHQPDRVAAAVIAHDRLVAALGSTAHFSPPTRPGGSSGRNTWLERRIS